MESDALRIGAKDLQDRLRQSLLLYPALLVRYDPLVVTSALYLYQADILQRNEIFRYCNVVKPEKLYRYLDLLEYDRFLIDRLISQIDLFDG